jgi:hypothetical protein
LKKPTLIDAGVFERLGDLPRSERADCLLALCELQDSFGRPHIHNGLSIRKLRGKTFECRANLRLRYLFQDRSDCLYVFDLATHDEVQRRLRSGKFE